LPISLPPALVRNRFHAGYRREGSGSRPPTRSSPRRSASAQPLPNQDTRGQV